MRNPTLPLLLLSFLVTPACNRQEPATGTSGADFGTTTTGGKACSAGGSCDGGSAANPDAAWSPPPTGTSCGAQTYPLALAQNAPNIHLVIDRSGSMSLNSQTGLPPDSTNTAKWEDLSSTLTSLLANYGNQANEWGMSIFPTTDTYESCTAGDISVPLQAPAFAVPEMLALIGQYNPTNLLSYNGKTPTTAAMQGVMDNVPLNATDRNNYVVLMTDGMPNCAGDPEQGVTPIITALANQTPSVRTFVIGFGSDTQSNPALLNAWAVAGHTDLSGTTKYYQASDATALDQAFQGIVSGIASCTFTLTAPPADPTLVVGELNSTPIATDASNGFTYDVGTQSVTFHGSACQQIQNDPSTQVSVVYGCPATDPPEIY